MSATPVLHYGDEATRGHRVVLDRLVTSRLLVQANSGGGKSRALRQLLEETHGRVQHLVIDPEGEFSTLREAFPYVLAGKEGDVALTPKTAKLLTRRLMELRASAILDLYDLSMQERRETVKLVLLELMSLPRALWRPLLVVIDEAHVFCPERGSGESQSTEAVITLCTQGRKRGFCAVLATQRISKLHKDAAAELLNKLVGRTGLDVDVKRAGDDLGFDKEQRQALKSLPPGEFFAYGPAIADTVARVRTGVVTTSHPEAGRVVSVPAPAPAALQSVLAELGDLPRQAEEEARTVASLEAQLKQARAELKRAQSGAGAPDPSLIAAAAERARQDVTDRWRTLVGDLHQRISTLAPALAGASDGLAQLERQAQHMLLDAAAPPSTPSRGNVPRNADSIPVHAAPHNVQVRNVASLLREAAPGGAPNGSSRSGPEQRILGSLAQLEILGIAPAQRIQVALFAGYTENGHFNNIVGRLNGEGLLSYPTPGFIALTALGRDAAPMGTSFASLEELHTFWLQKLSGPESRVLRALLAVYPHAWTRKELAARVGYTENGHFNNVVGRLSTMGIARYPSKGMVAASEVLFPDGLSGAR